MEDFNHFGEAAKAFHTAISQTIRKTAFDVQGYAVINAHKDTSFMANSIYVVTHNESTYGQEVEPKKKGQYLLPEIEKAENDTTAYIAVGAYYGIYLEMGTRFMPAYPYIAPAVEMVRPSFDKAMSLIEDKMRGMM